MSRLRHRRRPSDDAGITLVDTLVAVSLMAAVMVIFTTGVVGMYRSAQYTEGIAVAQSQLAAAFGRLDRQVRYASQLSQPGDESDATTLTTQNYWYAEWVAATPSGGLRCTQLRLPRTGSQLTLQVRDWGHGTTPPGFRALASMLDRPVANPFTRPAATPAQLGVRLSSTAPAGPGKSATQVSDVAFTALNFVVDTDDVDVCAQRRTS